jgi:type II secretory pathway pseudopilin PulG
MDTKRRFSLIELLMIVMLVGIVFAFVVPAFSAEKNRQKMEEAVYNLQVIARENYAFMQKTGHYTTSIDSLALDWNALTGKYSGLTGGRQLQRFYFDYSLTDSCAVAVTNTNFGKKGAELRYYQPSGPFRLGADDLSKEVFDYNWLP